MWNMKFFFIYLNITKRGEIYEGVEDDGHI